jgi:hypothetical protein
MRITANSLGNNSVQVVPKIGIFLHLSLGIALLRINTPTSALDTVRIAKGWDVVVVRILEFVQAVTEAVVMNVNVNIAVVKDASSAGQTGLLLGKC